MTTMIEYIAFGGMVVLTVSTVIGIALYVAR